MTKIADFRAQTPDQLSDELLKLKKFPQHRISSSARGRRHSEKENAATPLRVAALKSPKHGAECGSAE